MFMDAIIIRLRRKELIPLQKDEAIRLHLTVPVPGVEGGVALE